MSQEEEKVA